MRGVGMKNVWKGLTVGAFAGAAVGVVLDVFEGTGRRAAAVSARATKGAKKGATHLADIVEEKIDELPGRVRDLVE